MSKVVRHPRDFVVYLETDISNENAVVGVTFQIEATCSRRGEISGA